MHSLLTWWSAVLHVSQLLPDYIVKFASTAAFTLALTISVRQQNDGQRSQAAKVSVLVLDTSFIDRRGIVDGATSWKTAITNHSEVPIYRVSAFLHARWPQQLHPWDELRLQTHFLGDIKAKRSRDRTLASSG